ncbi:MAG: PAS domain-containing sensor histidine kinase [Flavobacteriales bacterium]
MEKNKFSHIDIYKLIFETSTEGILVCDREGRIRMLNDSLLTLFGYEREELLGNKMEILLPNNLKKSHVNLRDGYSKKPERKQMGAGRDLFGLKKNGDKLPVEISLNHMTIEGEFFVMALITDISKRKEQETQIHDLNAELEIKVQLRTKELKENQILYSLIAKKFPNGIICVLDKELKFNFAEGEELSKNGIKGKFLLNKSYLDSFNEENKEEVKEKLHRVFNGEVANFEIKKLRSVYEVHAVPLMYEENKAVSQLLIVENNVTKIKKIEDKMKQSLLKEKELGEMKSQFISMASHEFRTPLSTILSSVSLIEKYDELGNEEKKKVHFQKVKKNIKNLTNMLDDTLTVSRIEENTNELEITEFNLIDLIHEVIEECEGLRKEKQEVVINLAFNNEVSTDRKMLKTVLVNILSNAIKYSEESVLFGVAKDENNIVLNIDDRGIGIPERDQQHLFERFYRANNALNFQGTGLGLNIVSSYISFLKGEIKIQSKENLGTNVSIKIPNL